MRQEKFNSNLSDFKHGQSLNANLLTALAVLWFMKEFRQVFFRSEHMDKQPSSGEQSETERWPLTSPFSLQVEECVCRANCSWKIELSFHSEHPHPAVRTHTPQLILWWAFWTQIIQKVDCMVHTIQLHSCTKRSVQIKSPASIPAYGTQSKEQLMWHFLLIFLMWEKLRKKKTVTEFPDSANYKERLLAQTAILTIYPQQRLRVWFDGCECRRVNYTPHVK